VLDVKGCDTVVSSCDTAVDGCDTVGDSGDMVVPLMPVWHPSPVKMANLVPVGRVAKMVRLLMGFLMKFLLNHKNPS
jgi:hypothetical protein